MLGRLHIPLRFKNDGRESRFENTTKRSPMKHILILISFLLLNLPSAHGACEKAESMFSSATS